MKVSSGSPVEGPAEGVWVPTVDDNFPEVTILLLVSENRKGRCTQITSDRHSALR